MSSSRQPSQSSAASTNSARSRQTARIIAQTTVDAKLQADFEESGITFDYSASVREVETLVVDPSNTVTTSYLTQIQKSLTIQPFGCLVAIDDKNLKVIAYSDNAPELLTTVSHAVPAGLGDDDQSVVLTIGTDLRTIFTSPSSSALYKVFSFSDVSLHNPVLVHCKASGEQLYAIVHRVTGSIVIDFEPVKPFKVPNMTNASGALHSYKLAAKAIARLQSVPSGSMDRLCDTMVEQVFEMTDYDRTMAYKFHDDDHGEVVSEVTKPGLEPYLGLHYPATDIPQAARFLFMKNKVRMIVNCRAKSIKVNQDKNLPFDLTLCGSTLRAPHTCHLQYMENMASIASLVMAIIVNDDEEPSPVETGKTKRLWGLVVCHNTTPRFVPFPLRYACEFLAQVFAIHVSKEIELENQILEKNILRTQTLLCDMLMRDPPLGIVSQSPNVADLVKCDGAVLLYENETFKLGTTPTDSQLQDIISWMCECHEDSTGLSTDSLYDAGFPGAGALGDVVCGMAVVRITSKDMIFWFRSHTASEIQWGGARHEGGMKDDGRKMHPRSSFKAFLEVVRGRSLPWKDFEMDAIHSLQIILRNALINQSAAGETTRKMKKEDHQLEAVTNEVVRLIETATVPILAVDADGVINGWNSKVAELTGLCVEEAIGTLLITLVEDSWVDIVHEMLQMALQGNEKRNIEFEIRRRHGGTIRLVVNACASRDLEDNVVGVCFVAQDITGEKMALDKFTRIEGDYKVIVQNPSPLIPPIFGADELGWCSEWNLAMTKLTGWTRDEVIGKMLLGEVFGIHKTTTMYCRLKNQEAFVNLGVVLNSTMSRPEKVPFGFFSKKGKFVECLLCVSKTVSSGVFCFLQLASLQLQQQAIYVSEQNALKMLAYTKRQVWNSLNGIIYCRTEFGGAEEQNKMVTSAQCENQMSRVLDDDSDLDAIIDGNMDLEMVEFTLQPVLAACISQVMVKSKRKGVQIVNDVAQHVLTQTLYGDCVRLQQALADFLLTSLDFTAMGSRLSISACLTLEEALHLARLELRMMCDGGGGVPESLLKQMFASYGGEVFDGAGISLLISRKLIRLMNGDVRYLREAGNKTTFIVSLQLPLKA